MNVFNEVSKSLKRCLKEKVTITSATIVGFLITGVISQGNEITIEDPNIYGTLEYYQGKLPNAINGEKITATINIDGSKTFTGAEGSQAISAKGNTLINGGIINVTVKDKKFNNGYVVGMGNQGSIKSTLKNEGTINIDGNGITRTTGMGVNNTGHAENSNSGIINVTNGSALIDYSGGIDKSLINKGTINIKDGGIGIYYRKEKLTKGNVKNEGTINVEGNNAAGIVFGTDKEEESYLGKEIVNSGKIIVSGDNSYAILGDDSANTVYLETGSHIEGVIDLAGGNDTININGVGDDSNQESLTLKNIENMSIKNSNILFTKDTDIKLASNTYITSSTIVNEGSISAAEETQRLYVLNAQGGDTTITNNGTITSRNGGSGIVIGGENSKVINNGTIDAVGEPSLDGGWATKGVNVINSATLENNGTINVQSGTISGAGTYIYSGEVINTQSGKINLLGEKSAGVALYGGVINGADLTQKREAIVKNSGEIIGTNSGIRGIVVAKIAGENATIENSGLIQLNGNNSTGISAYRISGDVIGEGLIDTYITNSGRIELAGENSIGIAAKEGAKATNTGIIALNILGKDNTTYSGNIAMKGEDGATISSTGTIQLTDVTEKELSTDDYTNLQTFVKESLMIGGAHTGVVTNNLGEIIIANGDLADSELENLAEDEVKKANDTVKLTGTDLAGTLNASENFIGKFLANVVSENITISGTLNAGKANGIDIGAGNKVILNEGTINSGDIAINVGDNSAFESNGGIINGDITTGQGGTGTPIAARVLAEPTTEITLLNSTQLNGDILLGTTNDFVTIDSSTANLFAKDIKIDGGLGVDSLTLGTAGEKTIVKGTISNFENYSVNGTVIHESDAKIKGDNGTGNIKVTDQSLLVLRVSENKDHALTDISGNTISAEGSGKVMLETENLTVGSEGTTIDLAGTNLEIDENNLVASQFIYDINFAPVRTVGSILNISIKSLKEMGANSKYQAAFDSIVSSGNLSSISNTTTLGTSLDLDNLLYQVVEKNPYGLSTKMSHDSIMGWNNGIRSLKEIAELGEWHVQGTVIGSYENNKGNVSHNSNTTGLLATAEYGLMKDTSLGIAFGGGKQKGELKNSSSDLKSDSFYLGAYGKKSIDNFRILGSLGYQRNNFDIDRVLNNGLDKFDFSKSLDTNGFNVMLETRYILPLESSLTVEPKFILDYTYISQDSINEGYEPMGMRIDSHDISTYGAEIGADLIKTFAANGYKGKAFAGLAYAYTGGDTDENLEARIGNGSKFEIESAEISKNKGKVNIGVDIENSKGFNYGVGYTFEFGKNMKDSKITLGLGYKF